MRNTFKMRHPRLITLCMSLTVTALFSVTTAEISLDHISTIYVPYSYLTSPRYDIDSDAVEQFAYDAAEGYVYVIGDDYLQIIDFNDVENPEIVYKHLLPNRANDIAHCGRFVAYLLQGDDSQESGTIYIYEKYNRQTGEFNKLHQRIVSSQPEMLTFTSDCRKILTADEGTAGDDATEQYFLNPEGMVSIIKIEGDFASPNFDMTAVTFDHFNDRKKKYMDLGVRFPYHGRYTNYSEQTLSQSVEPEYIAINPRDNVAYINLQENNAIALLDLDTESIAEIVPLGNKSWLNLRLDTTDRDDAINLQTGFDIRSFYMPDAIKYFEIDGVGFLATADEGSDLDYKFDGSYWSDAKRGYKLIKEKRLASTMPQSMIDNLNDSLKLGRLEFSKYDGLSATEEGKIENLFFFGGRGFSILRADDLSRVFDSGDEIEREISERYPHVFNSETYPDDPANEMPSDLADKRSDNRGPECETIEVGVVNGKTVIFVGVDRASVIAIYTVTAGGKAKFETMHRSGGMGKTFAQLLDDRDLGDLDPKDMEFVPADQSTTGKPLLMVAGAASGTISLYHVIDDGAVDALTGNNSGRHLTSMGVFITMVISVTSILGLVLRK
ncbi:mesenchyme-specific cell surface glycoprotein-like [Lytechinus pictus]|uniref:mesenchyme-specific cell surface glycoprotein-like n=1 Tax=Lytechinus pictus TaxID=7653 RepID=UPI0030BA29E0